MSIHLHAYALNPRVATKAIFQKNLLNNAG